MDRKKTGFSKLLCLWVFKCDAMLAVGLRSCNVFEEIYGIRRKMTKREMGLFCFEETFGLSLCSCLLFWFGCGLCCACDTEEDGRRKS